MIAYHERFRTPHHVQAGSGRTRPLSARQEKMQADEAALSIANTTYVVTVCIRGRHCHPAPVTSQRIEPPRVCRRPFHLNHAASFCSSSMA
jgi:hypothetical protein